MVTKPEPGERSPRGQRRGPQRRAIRVRLEAGNTRTSRKRGSPRRHYRAPAQTPLHRPGGADPRRWSCLRDYSADPGTQPGKPGSRPRTRHSGLRRRFRGEDEHPPGVPSRPAPKFRGWGDPSFHLEDCAGEMDSLQRSRLPLLTVPRSALSKRFLPCLQLLLRVLPEAWTEATSRPSPEANSRATKGGRQFPDPGGGGPPLTIPKAPAIPPRGEMNEHPTRQIGAGQRPPTFTLWKGGIPERCRGKKQVAALRSLPRSLTVRTSRGGVPPGWRPLVPKVGPALG